MTDWSVQIAEFTEPAALVSAVPGTITRITPLPPGAFHLTTTTFRLGNVVLTHGVCSPLMMVVEVAATTAVLQFPLTNVETLVLNGRHVPPFGFAFYAARSELVRANTQAATYAALTVSVEVAEQLLCPPEGKLPAQGGTALLIAREADWQRMARLLHAAVDMAQLAPEVFATEPPCVSLRASLLDLGQALIAGATGSEAQTGTQASKAWRRIVLGADDYLNAHLDQPIYTEQLCQALSVSAASLGEAFRRTLGVSPHRYLKLRRLNMVRAALLRRDDPARLVKSVALAHGFWHLGQFAHDFQEAFGETPSELVTAAHGTAA